MIIGYRLFQYSMWLVIYRTRIYCGNLSCGIIMSNDPPYAKVHNQKGGSVHPANV